MSNIVKTDGKALTCADFAHDEGFRKKIEDTLGKRTPQFISSVLSLVDPSSTTTTCTSSATSLPSTMEAMQRSMYSAEL